MSMGTHGQRSADHGDLPAPERAVRELVGLLEGLEREGTTVMDLARAGQPIQPGRLYPDQTGIVDRRSRNQVYYHAHGDAHDEAGHFHTVRLFPDRAVHIVAVSMAPNGWPRALFTVNLWAVGDAYESAHNIKKYASGFWIDERRGPPALVRFVNLMLRAFLHEIERLQDDKFVRLCSHHAAHPSRNPFEDRSLEVLSWSDIDLRRRAAEAARQA